MSLPDGSGEPSYGYAKSRSPDEGPLATALR
jgi:hypothetical protein